MNKPIPVGARVQVTEKFTIDPAFVGKRGWVTKRPNVPHTYRYWVHLDEWEGEDAAPFTDGEIIVVPIETPREHVANVLQSLRSMPLGEIESRLRDALTALDAQEAVVKEAVGRLRERPLTDEDIRVVVALLRREEGR